VFRRLLRCGVPPLGPLFFTPSTFILRTQIFFFCSCGVFVCIMYCSFYLCTPFSSRLVLQKPCCPLPPRHRTFWTFLENSPWRFFSPRSAPFPCTLWPRFQSLFPLSNSFSPKRPSVEVLLFFEGSTPPKNFPPRGFVPPDPFYCAGMSF